MVDVLAGYDGLEVGHDVGMLGRDVVVFVEVVGEVVEGAFAVAHHELPVALAHAYHVGLVELPVEGVVLLLYSLAGEGGIDGDAVEAVVGKARVAVAGLVVLHAGDVGEGGHEVVEGEGLVGGLAWSDACGPAHDEGHADAAFVGGALEASEQAVAVEERRVGAALLVGAVVGGEDHDGVVGEAFAVEEVEDFADLCVEARDHSGKFGVTVVGGIVAAALAAGVDLLAVGAELVDIRQIDRVGGLAQLGVGERVGEDAEEGLVGGLTVKPFQSFLVDEVGRVLRPVGVVGTIHRPLDVLVEGDAHSGGVAERLAVAVEEVGIVEMCLELTEIAVVFVDAAGVGCRRASLVASGPLAEHSGGIARVVEYLGDDDVGGVVRLLSDNRIVYVVAVAVVEVGLVPVLLVASHMGVARVLAGHEGGARRCRHRRAGVGLREAYALCGEAVDARRGDELLAVAAEVAVAHVVAHDVENVGALRRRGGR